ncbi:MAG: YlxM family DNA-binding protein [Caulobacteraceae bacterium]
MYEKLVQIALLFDFYGQLLTEKQIEIVEMYYNNDLSLGEISEQLGISRQGVYDTLKRAEKTLFEYEEKLKLVDRFLSHKESMKQINRMIDEILEKDDFDKKYLKQRLTQIKEYITSAMKE